jgi:hypothetical protein
VESPACLRKSPRPEWLQQNKEEAETRGRDLKVRQQGADPIVLFLKNHTLWDNEYTDY